MSHDAFLLSGNPLDALVDCPMCSGEGYIIEGNDYEVRYECPCCDGSGEMDEAAADAWLADQKGGWE